MAKEKKFKSSPRTLLTPEQRRFRRQLTLNLTVLFVLIVGCAVGYSYLHAYVDHKLTYATEPPQVVLKNRPPWMTDFLAEQIINAVRPSTAGSAFDQQMLVTVCDILRHNPWIREVKQIRRAYGSRPGDTIEVDCEYRAPIALVRYGDVFALVDAQGVKLPELFNAGQLPKIMFGPDGRMNIRVIEGVVRPPPEPGRKWVSEDLAAGLELVELLYGKPYAEEVLAVRVHNFGGRIDPKEAWLVLVTRDRTEVRWGRPRSASDAFSEVTWQQKLDYMQRIVSQYHRLDAGHSAIDLRFDRVTFPSEGLESERSAGLREGP